MKVGDRIRVFEITETGQRCWSEFNGLKGLQRPQIDGFDMCPDLLTSEFHEDNLCFYLSNKEAKHVCTMVIKSIKNEKH